MKRLHFIEIAGHTMSGLAVAARANGYAVTGLDENVYPAAVNLSVRFLEKHQITWWRQADPKHVEGAAAVIISGATPPLHPEVVAAKAAGIPVKSFAQLWGELTADHYRIVVTGTHGKTTTTSLIAWILEVAGNRPDYLIGITPKNFDASVRLAGSRVAVTEGDEYQASMLETTSKFDYYRPDALVVTSIEHDHPDVFSDLAAVVSRFKGLIAGLAADARLYYWRGDPNIAALLPSSAAKAISYDTAAADWSCNAVSYNQAGLHFEVAHDGEALGQVAIGLYGTHNVLNTLAAIATATDYGVSWPVVVQALASFKGAARRFELASGPSDQIRVLDDYAHHPTAAALTIAAVKLHFPGRVIAVYQPHTYSRTAALLRQYHQAFDQADHTLLLPIEGARERHLEATVASGDIVAGASGKVELVERDGVVAAVRALARPSDTVLVMSVNGSHNLATELAQRLNRESA